MGWSFLVFGGGEGEEFSMILCFVFELQGENPRYKSNTCRVETERFFFLFPRDI